MKYALLLSLLLTHTLPALANEGGGSEAGNGGRGVICPTGVYLLDLWEAEHRDHETITRSADGLDDQVARVAQDLESIDPAYAAGFRRTLARVMSAWRPLGRGIHLQTIHDANVAITGEGCSEVQVARYSDHFGEELLEVDESILRRMSHTDQAALLVHETIYKLERDSFLDIHDSDHARHVTGLLFSSHLPSREELYRPGLRTQILGARARSTMPHFLGSRDSWYRSEHFRAGWEPRTTIFVSQPYLDTIFHALPSTSMAEADGRWNLRASWGWRSLFTSLVSWRETLTATEGSFDDFAQQWESLEIHAGTGDASLSRVEVSSLLNHRPWFARSVSWSFGHRFVVSGSRPAEAHGNSVVLDARPNTTSSVSHTLQFGPNLATLLGEESSFLSFLQNTPEEMTRQRPDARPAIANAAQTMQCKIYDEAGDYLLCQVTSNRRYLFYRRGE